CYPRRKYRFSVDAGSITEASVPTPAADTKAETTDSTEMAATYDDVMTHTMVFRGCTPLNQEIRTMSMFQELYQLAIGATLSLTISADENKGQMTINVIPKPHEDTDEKALSTPLGLTARPEELDAGFVTVLSDYRVAHMSLAQQAQATKEVLDAAKDAS